ncbi:hypothetical protein [Klebsiella aerogenes]|uniref:hypothetical protein n=1 Tax=Klebsiella aerogenes TaxID=548 RepID=UPI001D10B149|nr:hypothetical protein [Klebsiella aerogenes]
MIIVLNQAPLLLLQCKRIVKAHDKRSAKEIRNLFVNEDMPVYGFDNKGKEKLTKAHERIAAFSFGILLVILFVIIAIFIPNPTNFQYTFFRIILSAAVAGVVSFIPGFYRSQNIKLGKSRWSISCICDCLLRGSRSIMNWFAQ